MSQQGLLLLPLLGMVFITFGIMIWMLKLRYQAVRKDGLNPRYFKLYRGGKIPDYLAKVTQHFENLLELPILFYLAIILVLTLNLVDIVYIILAWCFFLSRCVHTAIHTSYNKLMHRKNTFILSTVVLILLWMRITLDVILL